MTVSKLTVSLDADVAERARQDVVEGKAKSVSAWLNDAARDRMDKDDLADVLAELFDETGGPLTGKETEEARRRLSSVEQP